MHYIIIGSDSVDNTQWVLHGIYMTKHDAERAQERNAMQEINPHRYTYSVVEIAPKEVALFKAMPLDGATKLELNSQFGKQATLESVHNTYNDTDSVRTEDFSNADLFGASEYCKECGAYIPSENTKTHVEWHNKLLP